MINNIEIQNFQSHADTILNFHEGLNIIIGESNSGKSAILRALRFVIENKPSGDSFIRKGQKECSVSLMIEDKDYIIRNKGKENLYILNGQEYRAFNQDVPEEIKQVINFNDINIQKQLDSPFLLSETSGEIAKFFNRVFNLEKIDSSQQKVKSKHSDTKKRVSILEEDLKEDQEKLKSFDWVEQAEKKIECLVEDEKIISYMQEEKETIQDIIENYEKTYESYIPLDDFTELQEKTKEFKNISDSMINDKAVISELRETISRVEKYTAMLKREKSELKNLENKLHEIMPEVCPVCHQKIQ